MNTVQTMPATIEDWAQKIMNEKYTELKETPNRIDRNALIHSYVDEFHIPIDMEFDVMNRVTFMLNAKMRDMAAPQDSQRKRGMDRLFR